jgi:hypothetical protein
LGLTLELTQMFPRGQKRILYCILGVGRIIQTPHGNATKIRQTLGDHGRHFEDIGAESILELLTRFVSAAVTLMKISLSCRAAIWRFRDSLSPKEDRGITSIGLG